MADLRVNPLLDAQGTYPFVRLTQAKQAAAARGIEIIDLGVGEPREATPGFINEALVRALLAEPVSTYPLAIGLHEHLGEREDRLLGPVRRDDGVVGVDLRAEAPVHP